MRLYFSALSLLSLLLGTPLQAQSLEHEEGAEEFVEERQYGWNQWICTAWAPGYYRPFVGASYFFREGSGEGQQARSIAHLSAIRQCQYYTGQQCRSRLESDCRVQRY